MTSRQIIASGFAVVLLIAISWIFVQPLILKRKIEQMERSGPTYKPIADSLTKRLMPDWNLDKIGIKYEKVLDHKISRAKTKFGRILSVRPCVFSPGQLRNISDRILRKVDFVGHYNCPMEFENEGNGLYVQLIQENGVWHFVDIRFLAKK